MRPLAIRVEYLLLSAAFALGILGWRSPVVAYILCAAYCAVRLLISAEKTWWPSGPVALQRIISLSGMMQRYERYVRFPLTVAALVFCAQVVLPFVHPASAATSATFARADSLAEDDVAFIAHQLSVVSHMIQQHYLQTAETRLREIKPVLANKADETHVAMARRAAALENRLADARRRDQVAEGKRRYAHIAAQSELVELYITKRRWDEASAAWAQLQHKYDVWQETHPGADVTRSVQQQMEDQRARIRHGVNARLLPREYAVDHVH